MGTWRRNLLAVLVVAALLTACTPYPSAPFATTSAPPATSAAAPSTSPAAASPEDSPSPVETAAPTPSSTLSPSPSPTDAEPSPARFCDTTVKSANPVLRRIRFVRAELGDQFFFEFCKPFDAEFRVKTVERLTAPGSGERVRLEGKYFYEVTLDGADAHTSDGRPTVSNETVTVRGRNVQQYKLIGDFEGQVTVGISTRRSGGIASTITTDTDDARHIICFLEIVN